MTTTLTDTQSALLQCERDWPQHSAAKEHAIRRRLAMSSVRYYQLLSRLIDNPVAIADDPFLTARVRLSQQTDRPLLREFAKNSGGRRVTSSSDRDLHA